MKKQTEMQIQLILFELCIEDSLSLSQIQIQLIVFQFGTGSPPCSLPYLSTDSPNLLGNEPPKNLISEITLLLLKAMSARNC